MSKLRSDKLWRTWERVSLHNCDVSCIVFGRLEKSREFNSSQTPKRFSLRGITFNQRTAVLDVQGCRYMVNCRNAFSTWKWLSMLDETVLLYSLLHLLTRKNFCPDSVPIFLSRYPAMPGRINLRKGKTSNTSPDGFPVRNSLLIFCRRAINSRSLVESRSPPKIDHSMFIEGRLKNPLLCLKEKQYYTFQQKEGSLQGDRQRR
jgi:hypothetical protein